MKTLKELWDNANFATTKPNEEKFHRFPLDYIFDEDQSVRWNKDKVEEANSKWNAEKKRLVDEKAKMTETANSKTLQYIQEYVNCDENAAQIIWSYIFGKYHDNMDVCLDELDELLTMVCKLHGCAL